VDHQLEPTINYIYITEFADPVTNAYDEGMGELGSCQGPLQHA